MFIVNCSYILIGDHRPAKLTKTSFSQEPFYYKSLRNFFESGVFGMGRLDYMKRQYFCHALQNQANQRQSAHG